VSPAAPVKTTNPPSISAWVKVMISVVRSDPDIYVPLSAFTPLIVIDPVPVIL